MAEDVVWGGREQILANREFIQELDRSGYRFQLLRFEGFQLFDFQEPFVLQLREALSNPAKEDPFGIVVYLKLPNEAGLRLLEFLDGAAKRTHLPLTLPLRFPVEGAEVMLEQISSLRAKYAPTEEVDDAVKQWSSLTHTVGGWSRN